MMYAGSSPGTSGTAIIGPVTEAQAQFGYSPELPHSPDLGPVDAFSGSALALTTVAIGICKYRDTFWYSRSLDDADLARAHVR
jgi:hypothetical protein